MEEGCHEREIWNGELLEALAASQPAPLEEAFTIPPANLTARRSPQARLERISPRTGLCTALPPDIPERDYITIRSSIRPSSPSAARRAHPFLANVCLHRMMILLEGQADAGGSPVPITAGPTKPRPGIGAGHMGSAILIRQEGATAAGTSHRNLAGLDLTYLNPMHPRSRCCSKISSRGRPATGCPITFRWASGSRLEDELETADRELHGGYHCGCA